MKPRVCFRNYFDLVNSKTTYDLFYKSLSHEEKLICISYELDNDENYQVAYYELIEKFFADCINNGKYEITIPSRSNGEVENICLFIDKQPTKIMVYMQSDLYEEFCLNDYYEETKDLIERYFNEIETLTLFAPETSREYLALKGIPNLHVMVNNSGLYKIYA